MKSNPESSKTVSTWLDLYSSPLDFTSQNELDACYQKIHTHQRIIRLCRGITCLTLGYVFSFLMFMALFLLTRFETIPLMIGCIGLWLASSLVLSLIWKAPKIRQYTAGVIDHYQTDHHKTYCWIRLHAALLPVEVSKSFARHTPAQTRVVLYDLVNGTETDFLCLPRTNIKGVSDFWMS